MRYTWDVMGQGTYTRGMYEDRARTVDKIMETFVLVDDWLLKTEASSRSAFYGLRSITETLVWLHYCLDG